jgi:hypothetical protein
MSPKASALCMSLHTRKGWGAEAKLVTREVIGMYVTFENSTAALGN